MTIDTESNRMFLRHILATIAYRIRKPLTNIPDSYPGYRVGEQSMTPLELFSHLADLFEWALSMARGENKWEFNKPQSWEVEVERFYSALKNLDDYLASSEIVHCSLERLFQGPIADSMTHVGQLAMLRRLAGSPIRGENYFVADIEVGSVGKDQKKAVREF